MKIVDGIIAVIYVIAMAGECMGYERKKNN